MNRQLLTKYRELGQFTNDINSFIERSYDLDTPLHIASFLGNYKDLKTMLKFIHTDNLNIRGDIGNTPLMCAVNNHKYDCIKLLLENGADPFIANDYGDTCFDWADMESHKIITSFGFQNK